MMMTDGYANRQTGPWWLLLVVVAAGCLVTVPQSGGDAMTEWICYPLAAVFALLTVMFTWLDTRDGGDHLLVCFGPLPLARRRLPYERVRAVKRDRSSLIEGWGIHLGPRGWIWNIWGREVVELELDKGRLRIGTDDPEGLMALLHERCELPSS